MKKRIVNEYEKAFLDFLTRPIKPFKYIRPDLSVDGYEFHDEIKKDYKVVEAEQYFSIERSTALCTALLFKSLPLTKNCI